jgi:triacylglycerol lipase
MRRERNNLMTLAQGLSQSFQHLIYPMIDDHTAVRQDLHPYVGEFVWTQENNYFGWRSLLGEEPGSAGVSPYAAAARTADVSGLPPTYISVGGLDLFLEENLTYADRLSRAGVPVELHLYPGAYHGFYRATNARVTRQAEHDTHEALRRFLRGQALPGPPSRERAPLPHPPALRPSVGSAGGRHS